MLGVSLLGHLLSSDTKNQTAVEKYLIRVYPVSVN